MTFERTNKHTQKEGERERKRDTYEKRNPFKSTEIG